MRRRVGFTPAGFRWDLCSDGPPSPRMWRGGQGGEGGEVAEPGSFFPPAIHARHSPPSPRSMPTPLSALAERWSQAKPAERANAQSYLIELCHALGVEPPRPAGTGYEFEFPIRVVARDGAETVNFVDCYKAGHFALEAKDQEPGTSEDRLLQRAFGQVRSYVGHLPDERPPYLLVLDVGRTLLVWDRWAGDYGGFKAGRRIDLRALAERPDDAALLRDIWTNPSARDPRGRAAAVTRDIAAKLAELAASLEDRGHPQEEVARFLIRVVFTMFAEDVDLLPAETFRDLLAEVPLAELPEALEDLWRAMDTGRRFGGRRLARFNGQFFREARALPLTREDQALLQLAAHKEWQDMEPSIFGTLLVRALDPRSGTGWAPSSPRGSTSSGWCGPPSRSRYGRTGPWCRRRCCSFERRGKRRTAAPR